MRKILERIGFINTNIHGGIIWPFKAPPRWVFRSWDDFKGHCRFWGLKPYIFRNVPGVVKWRKGRLLPRRWGFGWLGFEFGDRGH